MPFEEVILVDPLDNAIGRMEKLEAHRKGLMHRAFSVLIFNDNNELLLHQRAYEKYHSGGLWTNTCCGHPRPSEVTIQAAQRRLKEEMGFETTLHKLYDFTYQTSLTHELSEHEFDHVFVGHFNDIPTPNPAEVSDWQYIPIPQLQKHLSAKPHQYTYWFKLIMQKLIENQIPINNHIITP